MLCRLGLFLYFFIVTVVHGAQQTIAHTVVYSNNSPFGLIEVVTAWEPGVLYVCENKDYSLVHSIITQGDTTYMGAPYEPLATASFCFTKCVKSVLLLGLGGGEFLSYLINYFRDTRTDVVEINPAMIEIVKEFRKIESKKTVKFICKDAFKHIASISTNYDLIYCDIYFFRSSTAKEYESFFYRVKKHLNESGVFVFNAHIPSIPQVVVTDMFKNFENVTAAITSEGSNIVFICYQGSAKKKEDLEKIAKDMQSKYNFRYALPNQLQKFKFIPPAERNTWIAKFPVLE